MSSSPVSTSPHRWKFFRTGGLDQVMLETGADLMSLRTLDQKLWVALSCPVKGLEIDEKTLALIDTDGDGRIRAGEVLKALDWLALHLKDPGVILAPKSTFPLSAINEQTPEGQVVLASAKQILFDLGRSNEAELSVEDLIDTKRIFENTKFNGDGLITDLSADAAEEKQAIVEIISTLGSAVDRSGAPGISQAKIDQFFAETAAFESWASMGSIAGGDHGLEVTANAYEAVQAVRAKVEDYFTRCRLAAFDPRALEALNHPSAEYLPLVSKDLKVTASELSGLPLSRIEPHRALPLSEGINPAWADAISTLRHNAVALVFDENKSSLTADEWAALTGKLAAYEVWFSSKAGAVVEKLGIDRIKALNTSGLKAALTALVAKDTALEKQAASIHAVERLVRYYRDLRTLLHNFVNFADFYDRSKNATFQAGTLYLDSRSCILCVRVDDPTAHSILASLSNTYIAYCEMRRPGSISMKIAACFTQGDSDYLMPGRNGVFYDRKGQDWDATIIKIIDNPISIHQAFWSPYKKFIRMIQDQIAKRAAAADAEASGKLGAVAVATANADKTPPAPEVPAKKIDVGTVAALGVAFGAIGTFVSGLAGHAMGVISAGPLVIIAAIIGVIAVISGPSMVIAWLKLRQRTIGPILDANGWAVNGRVKVNIPLGTSLTGHATLPPGSSHLLADPFEDKAAARRKRLIMVFILVVIGVWLGYNLWFAPSHDLPHHLWPFERAKE